MERAATPFRGEHARARALPRLESQRLRPTRRFEVEDFFKQNQRRRSPLGAQGRALCFGANIGRFFLWWQPCRLHPLIASDTPASTGETKATARRYSDAATALNRRSIIFA